MINNITLPKYPAWIVQTTQNLVFNATQAYYLYNTIPGCTDPGVPNFNFRVSFNFQNFLKLAKIFLLLVEKKLFAFLIFLVSSF